MFEVMSEFPKTSSYTFKPFVDDQARLDRAAQLSRRKRSEVSRMLLQRALDLFERDFKISEHMPPVVDVSPPSPDPDPKQKALGNEGKKEARTLLKTGTR